MNETITACENIARDFSWVPGVLGIVGPILAPFVALFGAIHLFNKKQKSDRVDERLKRVTDLYSDFLGHLEMLWVLYGSKNPKGDEDLARLYSMASRIELLGSERVSEQANAIVTSVLQLFDPERSATFSRDGKKRTKIDDFLWERSQLVEAMKEAVGK